MALGEAGAAVVPGSDGMGIADLYCIAGRRPESIGSSAMNSKHRDGQPGPDSKKEAASPDAPASPTTQSSGYPEKHGPRFDSDGWGEANAERSARAGTAGPGSQGQATGERSFDHGPDDTAAAEAASDASLREPGDRGAADAQSPSQEQVERSSDDAAPDSSPESLHRDGHQRDYGQGGGQGYVHTGKPGAPDPDPDGK